MLAVKDLSKLDDPFSMACHIDAALTSSLHGLLSALLLAMRQPAAVVTQEVY